MSLIEAVIQGTLKPDGTLILDQAPKLSPGRVTVVLRQESGLQSPSSQGDWFEFLLNARRSLETSGCHFLDEQEMNARVDWLREDDRVDDLLSDRGENGRTSER